MCGIPYSVRVMVTSYDGVDGLAVVAMAAGTANVLRRASATTEGSRRMPLPSTRPGTTPAATPRCHGEFVCRQRRGRHTKSDYRALVHAREDQLRLSLCAACAAAGTQTPARASQV